MSKKQQILDQPENEKRERAKLQLFEYLFNGNKLAGVATDEDLETIMNICQNGSDTGRELSELKTEFIRFLDTVRSMRAHQKAFYAAKPGTSIRIDALKESKKYEKLTDEFLKEQEKPTETKPTTPTLF